MCNFTYLKGVIYNVLVCQPTEANLDRVVGGIHIEMHMPLFQVRYILQFLFHSIFVYLFGTHIEGSQVGSPFLRLAVYTIQFLLYFNS